MPSYNFKNSNLWNRETFGNAQSFNSNSSTEANNSPRSRSRTITKKKNTKSKAAVAKSKSKSKSKAAVAKSKSKSKAAVAKSKKKKVSSISNNFEHIEITSSLPSNNFEHIEITSSLPSNNFEHVEMPSINNVYFNAQEHVAQDNTKKAKNAKKAKNTKKARNAKKAEKATKDKCSTPVEDLTELDETFRDYWYKAAHNKWGTLEEISIRVALKAANLFNIKLESNFKDTIELIKSSKFSDEFVETLLTLDSIVKKAGKMSDKAFMKLVEKKIPKTVFNHIKEHSYMKDAKALKNIITLINECYLASL